MRNFIAEFGLALTLACCSTQAHAEAGRAAPDAGSLFVVNAHVFGNAKADAVHIQAGRIEAVGTRAEVGAAAPAEVTVLDAEGGVILPGLRDGHIHMLSGGLALTRLDLSAFDSVSAVAQAVRDYARSHPGEAWLLGRGWQYRIVSEGTFPTRQSLDRVVDDRPVLLTSYDGHCVWANSRALARAGIAATTPDPAGGRIVREPDGKTPAGTLLESAADLAWKAVPDPDRATQLDALNRAVQHCLSLGLTAVDDIDSDPEVLGLYGELLRTGRLPLRVTVSLPLEGDLEQYEAYRRRCTSPFLQFGFLKGFVDGVVESKTASLLAPYADTEEVGRPLVDRKRLRELIVRAQSRNFAVQLHVVGDGAVRLSLDAFAGVPCGRTDPRVRGRLEHIEVLDPADAPRFRKLGIAASMMPMHAVSSGDRPEEDVWPTSLGSKEGAERLNHAFAWRELLDAGAVLAFGSDWPVVSADPLRGIAMAVTRQNEREKPAGGWHPHQRVSAEEAVHAYTVGPALAMGRGGKLGRIDPGYRGDLVVLQPGVDPHRPLTLWHGSRVHYVVVEGLVRWAETTRRMTEK